MAEQCNPGFGISAIPVSGLGLSHHLAMAAIHGNEDVGDLTPRQVLALNLRILMEAAGFANLDDVVMASRGRLSRGTLDRIRREESATSVDNLQVLAEVFGLEAWQLLVPGLEAQAGPDGLPLVSGLPSWPLNMVDAHRFLVLSEPQRAYAQARFVSAIEEVETRLNPRRETAQADRDARATEAARLSPKGRVAPRRGTRKG